MGDPVSLKWWHIALMALGLAYSVVTTSVNTFGGAIQQRQQLQDEVSALAQQCTELKAAQDRIDTHLEFDDREIARLEAKTGVNIPDPPPMARRKRSEGK
jgi:hypothetical protein